MHSLAQVTEAIPDYDWASVGIAGVLVGTITFCVVYWFFVVYVPHAKQKQHVELSRDGKLVDFIEQLSQSHRSEVEYKQQTVALLSKMDQRQDGHADVCERTHAMVSELHANQNHRRRDAS